MESQASQDRDVTAPVGVNTAATLTTQQQPTGGKTQEAVRPRAHSLSKIE